MEIARIRDEDCVGCARCIPACPVDAIVGRVGFLHQIVQESCIGCGLCVSPCPMDCIEMSEAPLETDRKTLAHHAKIRYQRRMLRLKHVQPQLVDRHSHKQPLKDEITAAVQRIQDKKTHEKI